MKKYFTHIILTAGLSAILGSLTLSAQDQREVANIPFAFEVNHVSLPAGEYTVQRMNAELFQMYDADGHSTFLMAPVKTEGKPDPRLTFRCYGNDRVLSEIWTDDGIGYGLLKSKWEKDRKLEMSAVISVALKHR
jgi:hypothetical protein